MPTPEPSEDSRSSKASEGETISVPDSERGVDSIAPNLDFTDFEAVKEAEAKVAEAEAEAAVLKATMLPPDFTLQSKSSLL